MKILMARKVIISLLIMFFFNSVLSIMIQTYSENCADAEKFLHDHKSCINISFEHVHADNGKCIKCDGTKKCQVCSGSGKNNSNDDCSICSGSGKCYYCSGTGKS